MPLCLMAVTGYWAMSFEILDLVSIWEIETRAQVPNVCNSGTSVMKAGISQHVYALADFIARITYIARTHLSYHAMQRQREDYHTGH